MGFNEDIATLRKKIQDLIRLEGIDHTNFREMYQATLIEVVCEAERKRRDIQDALKTLNRQVAVEEGRLMALDMFGAIIGRTLDGYNTAAEKALREEAERKQEVAEKVALAAEASQPSSEPPTGRRRKKVQEQ